MSAICDISVKRSASLKKKMEFMSNSRWKEVLCRHILDLRNNLGRMLTSTEKWCWKRDSLHQKRLNYWIYSLEEVDFGILNADMKYVSVSRFLVMLSKQKKHIKCLDFFRKGREPVAILKRLLFYKQNCYTVLVGTILYCIHLEEGYSWV